MITTEFKHQIREAILEARENYSGSDAAFSRTLGIHKSIYNRIKNGEIEKTLAEPKWLSLARKFNLSAKKVPWNVAITSVYKEMEDQFRFCQKYSRSMMLIDDTGIGKTICAQHVVKGMKDSFYIDCSQCGSKKLFIRSLANNIGVDSTQKYDDIIEDIIFNINMLGSVFIVLDEYGDLDQATMILIKRIINATKDCCSWFAMGSDGLRRRIEQGIISKKMGYREMFRRFSEEFIQYSPIGREDREQWYRELYTQVAEINLKDKKAVKSVVTKCLIHKRAQKNTNTKEEKEKGVGKSDPNYLPSVDYIQFLILLENDKAA